MKTNIGLNEDYQRNMSQKLNEFLSDVQVFYMNVRGYHWNIKGKLFFVLHEKFEGLYNQLSDMADEVAERILMLGGAPLHSFSEYLKLANVKEKLNVSTADGTISETLKDLKHLLESERELVKLASENGDDGTVNLISEYISGQEKLIWMLSTSISE